MTGTSTVLLASISDMPLDLQTLIELVTDDTCGAVAPFLGLVRNHDNNTSVSHLTYEAHPDAAAHLTEVASRVAKQHQGVRIAVTHRVGTLGIGDVAVVAAVASAHRAEAFATVVQLVEDLKADVPIWKHQVFSDGSEEWVGSPG
ncbi:MAG: molybdenum cofactor biosynthesis protein MoaE [Actinomycetales bacterium]|nr:molybdenum cofactor biosynthesis protein MoaE [Actinomycetales bacterium]